ncbi:MAG: metallophosphoesterase, partial [Rhodospirillales bacterium]|nr:metallophosphoesterase [Rhodospirillales bacterium]
MTGNLGKRLFNFAVITDTHLNQGETECNSPYETNKLANGRMRHVVRDLNRRQLEFVIHLGDLLHPVPAIPHLYERAAQCFKDQVADLRHSLYVVPGNHDVGDKPIDWGPAGVVQDAFLDLWKEHFGA